MRRFAFACLCLVLSGCGYNTWWNAPFTSGSNPNMPAGTSENMRRVAGEEVDTPPLNPEPGDIWPGPVQATPTLQDLEQQGLQSGPEQPVPGSPESEGKGPAPYTPPPPPNSRQFHTARSRPVARRSASGAARAADCHRAAAHPEPRRSGLPDPKGPRRQLRRHHRLSNPHHAGRRFRHRGTQWQWHQHDHTFGWFDRDGSHATLSCHGRCRRPFDHPLLRLAA